MDLLIKNATILLDNKLVEADIHITGNRIARISKNISLQAYDEIFNATGKIAFPGLINLHTHVPMSLLRGVADDYELMEWLSKHIWPREAKLSRKDVYYGSLLGIAEMLLTGTTTFLDMYFYEDAVADAAKLLGIRAFLSTGIIDLFDENRAEKEIKTALKEKEYIESLNTNRIKYVFGPHAPYTVSKETLLKIKELAGKEYLITIHVAETEAEVKQIKEMTGLRPVEYLSNIGFLDSNVIIAHGIHLNKNEIDILSSKKVSIAHCPASNMKLASGVLKMKELLEAGVNLGLSTDGPASNNTLSLLEEMRLASLLQKVYYRDASFPKADMVLKMATENGAKALGIKAGKIKEGYLADIAFFSKKDIRNIPGFNPIATLVYAPPLVTDVIVDGALTVRDRQIENLDMEKVIDKANEIAEKFREV